MDGSVRVRTYVAVSCPHAQGAIRLPTWFPPRNRRTRDANATTTPGREHVNNVAAGPSTPGPPAPVGAPGCCHCPRTAAQAQSAEPEDGQLGSSSSACPHVRARHRDPDAPCPIGRSPVVDRGAVVCLLARVLIEVPSRAA